MLNKTAYFLAFSTCLILTASCSSSTHPPPTSSTTDSGTTPGNDTSTTTKTIVDHGTVEDYGSGEKLANITITEGGQTTKTDAMGAYSLTLAADTPVQMMLSGDKYTKTWLGEQSFAADYDRGPVPIPDLGLFHVGQTSFDGFDITKGIVYMLVKTTGSCTDVTGGTATVNAPAGAKLTYFADKLPDSTLTAFKKPSEAYFPVAAVYNVPPGSALDVTITHPTCKMKAFPAAVGGVTYTGKVTVEAGDVNSVAFFVLE